MLWKVLGGGQAPKHHLAPGPPRRLVVFLSLFIYFFLKPDGKFDMLRMHTALFNPTMKESSLYNPSQHKGQIRL